MSNDEQLLAQGRILSDYTETKTRLAALRGQAETVSKLLTGAASALNDRQATRTSLSIHGENIRVQYPNASHLNADLKWPSKDEIIGLYDAITETKQRLRLHLKQLQDLGLPVNDQI